MSTRRGWLAALLLLFGGLAVYRLTHPRVAAVRALPPPAPFPQPVVPESAEPLTLERTVLVPPVESRPADRLSSWAVPAGGFAALVAGLAAYYAWAEALPDVSLWWEIALVALLVIPATFGLVWLALPARGSRYLPPAVLALIGLAVLLEAVDLETPANFVKLAALTGAGWFFLRFFEDVSWVLLVALLIVPVDIYSVAQGPTKHILEERPGVFDRLSIAFPVPGEQSSAQLGLPDVLFFALFLGAAARFGLRPRLTWLLCTLSFGATLALGAGFDVSGLPALPLLSAGFVLANADLLWARLRRGRRLA